MYIRDRASKATGVVSKKVVDEGLALSDNHPKHVFDGATQYNVGMRAEICEVDNDIRFIESIGDKVAPRVEHRSANLACSRRHEVNQRGPGSLCDLRQPRRRMRQCRQTLEELE